MLAQQGRRVMIKKTKQKRKGNKEKRKKREIKEKKRTEKNRGLSNEAVAWMLARKNKRQKGRIPE